MSITNHTEPANSKKTPSIINRWRFAGLSAPDLLPHLQRHLTMQNPMANWQLVWLNNEGRPVIGLLPKVSWSVYFRANQKLSTLVDNTKNNANYKIIKTCRNTDSATSQYMSYTEWQKELIVYSEAYESPNNDLSNLDNKTIMNKPSYQHGLMGYIGYDIAARELSPTMNIPLAKQPCAVLGHYDIYLSPVEENNRTIWQLTTALSELSNTDTVSKLRESLQYLDNELNNEQAKNSFKNQIQPAVLILKAQWQKSDYEQAFIRTQRYLENGDCYQINLTQAWQGHLQKSDNQTLQLLDYLPSLHANTNAPFAGYLGLKDLANTDAKTNNIKDKNLQPLNFELLSCSPELFFTFTTDQKTNTRHIITKPIKGTLPRGINIKQDNALKQQLIASDKDRSENVMIVDLLRNDLGKYAKTGSVKVPKLFAIESFSNVHHMVSTITAELKTDIHPLAVLFGSLPAGSITGTPKKRAVEIIAELEGAARGAYCGTMGYMNFEGSGQWNVLIRTLQAGTDADNKKQVCLWAGGGITIASDCASEYQECLDKVGNLLEVLQQPNC